MPRTWRPPFALDLGAVLAPLRRGPGDPSFQLDAAGAVWLTANTPAGPGTLRLRRPDGAEGSAAGGAVGGVVGGTAGGAVEGTAWGDGAEWLLEELPALLGGLDDDSAFQPHHPLIAESRRRRPGIRLGATGRVWDALLPSVLEQKVTGTEAYRSYRQLCRRFGLPAPGPAPAGMRVPPTPRAVLGITDWEWHRAGVDGGRRRALVAAAQVAHRLQEAAGLKGERGRALLCKVPGVGPWTAAEVAQRVWGDPDAVSFGDYHLAAHVGWALVGEPVDDARMAELLAPCAPQRHRAVRYLLASGVRKPRFGPRFAPRDYRAM